jgi:hypothetical protein
VTLLSKSLVMMAGVCDMAGFKVFGSKGFNGGNAK